MPLSDVIDNFRAGYDLTRTKINNSWTFGSDWIINAGIILIDNLERMTSYELKIEVAFVVYPAE